MTPTDFQEAVWSHLRQIPPGRVTTYGNIAKALGKPGARQAVGEAVVASRTGRRPPHRRR